MSNNQLIKAEVRATCLLAGPMIASSLVQVANGFIDTVMLGRYHPEHLAAGALGSSLWIFLILIGVGFSMGISPIVAQLSGSNKSDQIKSVFQQGVWLNAVLAAVMVIALFNAKAILVWIDIEPVLIPLVDDYLKYVAIGVGASQLYLAGRFVSEGIEYAKPMMIIQLILLPLNALGNYVLIFGNWGAPALGVTGAGIATSVAMILSLGLMLLNLKWNARYHYLNLFENFSWPDFKLLRDILIISTPIALSMAMESTMFTAVALLMGKLGVLPLAGHQIAINYASLMFMFPLGLSMAATVRVGNAVGRMDFIDAKRRGWVTIGLSAIFMLCSAGILLFFNESIARVYTNDESVLQVAASLLVLAGIFQISDGIQVSAAGALRGYKDTKVSMYISFLGYWLIGLPLAYYLCFHRGIGASGLWWGLIVGLTIAAVLLVFRYHRFSIDSISKDQSIQLR